MITLEEFEKNLQKFEKATTKKISSFKTKDEIIKYAWENNFYKFHEIITTLKLNKTFRDVADACFNRITSVQETHIESLLLNKLSKINFKGTAKADLKKLQTLQKQANKITDEYNKIAKRLNYTKRFGTIMAECNGDEFYIDQNEDNSYTVSSDYEGNLLTNIKTKKEAEEAAAKLQLLAMEENFADNTPYADVYSSCESWFPSGINC